MSGILDTGYLCQAAPSSGHVRCVQAGRGGGRRDRQFDKITVREL